MLPVYLEIMIMVFYRIENPRLSGHYKLLFTYRRHSSQTISFRNGTSASFPQSAHVFSFSADISAFGFIFLILIPSFPLSSVLQNVYNVSRPVY